MTSLSALLLNNNLLSATIPTTLGDCSGLTQLYLDENFLRGIPPVSLGNLHNLGKSSASLDASCVVVAYLDTHQHAALSCFQKSYDFLGIASQAQYPIRYVF